MKSYALREPDYRELSAFVVELSAGRVAAGRAVMWPLPLAKLRIRSLPAGLTVHGDLDLRQCQRLRRIGDGLTVAGRLSIGGRCAETMWWEEDSVTCRMSVVNGAEFAHLYSRESQPPLPNLPERLRVQGDLCLRSCPQLTELPADVEFSGGLLIDGCRRFAALPDPLRIRRDLFLKSCRRLGELPESLDVDGDVSLIGLRIVRLPENLRIGGHLVLQCCPRLEALPEGLNVAGDLVIRDCPIRELPIGLRVGGNLKISRCARLVTLPEELRVARDIHVDKCDAFTSIPEGLDIRHGLRITRCTKLTALPDGLAVPRILDLRGCTALARFPRRARVGLCAGPFAYQAVLVLVDCSGLEALPGDLRLGGPIDLAGSGLTDLPETLASTQIMWRGLRVRPVVVFHPETLTVHEILAEPNSELRRLMLERVGCERVLEMGEAETIDEDVDAGGRRRLVEVSVRLQRSPHRYLNCRCPSTSREYLLRVPPTIESCHAAAAWLAGFENPDEYAPRLET